MVNPKQTVKEFINVLVEAEVIAALGDTLAEVVLPIEVSK